MMIEQNAFGFRRLSSRHNGLAIWNGARLILLWRNTSALLLQRLSEPCRDGGNAQTRRLQGVRTRVGSFSWMPTKAV
jgi:hypothetical protein